MGAKKGGVEENLDRVVFLLSTMEGVRAVGLSGSRAAGNADAFSDVDLFVYAARHVPSGEARLQFYREMDGAETCRFDIDLGVIRSDEILLDGVLFDLNWAGVPDTEQFLRELARDFECDEYLPGGLLKTRPLYDPDDSLARLERAVPSYPPERAIQRVRRVLQSARHEFDVLHHIEAAAVRDDAYGFLKVEYELLDQWFRGLFSLNRTWLCDDKRLLEIVDTLPLRPNNTPARIESIILRRGPDADLAACHDSLHTLFVDLAKLARSAYSDVILPPGWCS